MRLPLQIAVGQAFVILFPIGLTLLAISVLVEVDRNVDAITIDDRTAIQAATEVHRALLRYEIARRDQAVDRMEEERNRFASAMQGLRETARGDVASLPISRINEAAQAFFDGQRTLVDLLDSLGDVADLQDALVSRGATRILKVSQSGTGLLGVLGALGLLTALSFGYWLTRTVGYPLEKTVRAVEAIAAGDLHRRVGGTGPSVVLDRLTSGVNQIADRLQRMDADRRMDYLLVRAAAERLLEERSAPAGVLTPGKRLLVANREARLLVNARPAAVEEMAEGRTKDEPSAQKRFPLTGPDGVLLGELVFFGSPSHADATPGGTG